MLRENPLTMPLCPPQIPDGRRDKISNHTWRKIHIYFHTLLSQTFRSEQSAYSTQTFWIGEDFLCSNQQTSTQCNFLTWYINSENNAPNKPNYVGLQRKYIEFWITEYLDSVHRSSFNTKVKTQRFRNTIGLHPQKGHINKYILNHLAKNCRAWGYYTFYWYKCWGEYFDLRQRT